jgi:hypothetical protein
LYYEAPEKQTQPAPARQVAEPAGTAGGMKRAIRVIRGSSVRGRAQIGA